MSTNGSSETGCRPEVRPSNNTCSQRELSVTTSAISMTFGIFSNNLLGHLINGSLVLFVYSSQKKWESFDPHHVICSIFGVCMVFFGLSPLLLGSAMAVERCIGVTRPIFHSTALASHHMKRLLGLTWLLAALVAVLPVLLWRPYKIQSSRSWCFFHMEGAKDWLDMLPPLLFSMLGLLALLLSIVCNTLTSCVLLQARLRRKHHCTGTSHHIEMICQLLVIMLVSCVCWGPLLFHIIMLSTGGKDMPGSVTLLMVVRIATWNQILDPWVYILLRKAVLKKIFMLLHSCWGPKSPHPHCWQRGFLHSSMETSHLAVGLSKCRCLSDLHLPDRAIKSIA
uniref:Thromboxane A2 receptor n=1 Tax=Mola mola TaxID=94237 RepID=A0A3Q3VI84_MOLML